jgi:DNA-binding MarR family transcriptional regulator
MKPGPQPRDWSALGLKAAAILGATKRGLSVSALAQAMDLPQPEAVQLVKKMRDKGLLDIDKGMGKNAPHWFLSERGVTAFENELDIDLSVAVRGQRRYHPQALMQCLGMALTPPPVPAGARHVVWK